MDNILKVLLSVLGVAGLLALLTPSGNIVASVTPELVAEVDRPVNEALALTADEPEIEETDEQFVKFGEPMIDGNPIGDDGAPQQPLQKANNPDQSLTTDDGSLAIDYKLMLENAARGAYGGVQPYQPTVPAVIRAEMPAIDN